MANLRFMLVVAAITVGFGSLGCSRSPGGEPVPSADSHDGQTLTEESGQTRPPRQWWRDESITAQLELTEDQAQEISDLMAVSTGDAKQQRQRERQLSVTYLRTLNKDPYDPALADQMSEKLIEVLSSRHRQRIENIRALRDILTHEQWKKLWEIAPRVFQIGRAQVYLGPRVSVTDTDVSPNPTP